MFTDADFGAMVQGMGTGVLVHDAGTKSILWANDAACAMFGFEVDELRPLKAHHMSSPERQYRRAVGVAWLQDAVDTGSSRRRWKYRAKDGREFLTDALASHVRLHDRDVVMVTFRYVPDDDPLENRLQRTAFYLQRIMESSSAGICLLDEQNRVEDISEHAAHLFGTTVSHALGRRVDALARATPSLAEVEDRLSRPGVPVEFTLEVSVDARTRWLSMDVETIAHDGIESRMATIRDITERMEFARESERQQARLQYLSRYNAMGDMAMTIAHELGQPLAAARNSLMGLQSRVNAGTLTDADLAYGMDLASRQLARASKIVSSVKRYVQRIESSVAREDLNAIVRESLFFAELRASAAEVVLRHELTGQDLPVHAEHILIGQVMLNLCFNAVDEMVGARAQDASVVAEVVVRTRRDADQAVCEVVDTGRGMATFGEVTGFSHKEGGSGLGLMICHQIMERHGGRLEFLPNRPAGTIACMRLPLVGQTPGERVGRREGAGGGIAVD